MFGRKKRILRKVIKEEQEMVNKLRQDCKDGKIPDEECLKIEYSWEEIADDLQKIAPAEALTRKQFVKRLGISAGMIGALLLVAVVYTKVTYFPSSTSSSSMDGEAFAYDYISEVRTTQLEFPSLTIQSRATMSDLIRFDHHDGVVVDVVATENEVHAYYVVPDKNLERSGLYQMTVDPQSMRVQSRELVIQGELQDAAIMQDTASGGIVVAHAQMGEEPQLVLTHANNDWTGVQQQSMDLLDEESVVGMQLVETTGWDQDQSVRYLLLTTYDPGPDAGILDVKGPLLRLFDENWELVGDPLRLATNSYVVDTHSSIVPTGGNSFYVIGNAHKTFDAQDDRGDDLHLFKYDQDRKLFEVVQMTNNGLPHDFWPNDAMYVEEHNVIYVPYHQVVGANTTVHGENGYPIDAGQLFVTGLRDTTTTIGTIFASDYDYTEIGDDRIEGGKNVHIDLMGDRMYILHQAIVANDLLDGASEEYQVLRMQWFDLNVIK